MMKTTAEVRQYPSSQISTNSTSDSTKRDSVIALGQFRDRESITEAARGLVEGIDKVEASMWAQLRTGGAARVQLPLPEAFILRDCSLSGDVESN